MKHSTTQPGNEPRPEVSAPALRRRLFDALDKPTKAYTAHVDEPEAYLQNARKHLLASLVEPIWVTAKVGQQARSLGVNGDAIEGYLLAAADGYWLIYDPARDHFHVAWGLSIDHMEASGFFGSDPLALWLN